jgi:predicted nuclease of predicted toxin-antitoxin system
VRVLLDENLPHDLAGALTGHLVLTVHQLGWAGVKNGELLHRAAGQFDAFITMDANLQFQRRLQDRPFGAIVLRARSNRTTDLLPLVDPILVTLSALQPGAVQHVGA